MTTAGNLKFKAICFPVLPLWNDLNDYPERLLSSAIQSCLEKVAHQKYASVAFPTFELELLQYPVERVAKTMVNAIKEFLETNPFTSLTNVSIIICSGLRDTVKYFQKELHQRTYTGHGNYFYNHYV